MQDIIHVVRPGERPEFGSCPACNHLFLAGDKYRLAPVSISSDEKIMVYYWYVCPDCIDKANEMEVRKI